MHMLHGDSSDVENSEIYAAEQFSTVDSQNWHQPVEALWPVRQGPTGLTSPGRVRVQLGFFIDLDL